MKLKSIACFILTLLILSTSFTGLAYGASRAIIESPIEIPIKNELLDKDFILEDLKKPIIGPSIDDSIIKDPTLDDEIENLFPDEEEQSREFPSEYCMRDEYIIYAQNQDKHGYCWNFASTMAMSTAIMKATGEYYDFSELWVGLAAYNRSSYSKLGAGGSISTHYNSIKESGIMLECDLPYINSYIMVNENAENYYNFYSKYADNHLSDCMTNVSYSKTNIDKIKEHIMDYGSIYMSFSFRSGFLDGGDGSYYLTPNQTNTNSAHAVSVIGWDDNYEREFYLNGSDTPTVFKGAWLILNSYTETSGQDGISYIFYDDKNSYSIYGYKYSTDTTKDFYFYDKIENGYSYPTNLKGKYYGDYTAEDALTKQKNIFYDDVSLEYSYVASDGAYITDINIYLNGQNVTGDFNISIDNDAKRFYISKENADYGQYKVLVSYGNGQKSDTYLNNFFVTYGLVGEEIEFDYDNNSLGFNTGRDLELYSYTEPNKNYVIYTNKLNGTVSFLQTETSVYSDKNMSIPSITYQIGEDGTYLWKHTIESNSGFDLTYNFNFEYYEDSTLQPVYVYYDLGGGVNHQKNYHMELANGTTDIMLYEPTREGYTFAGWYLDYGNGSRPLKKDGDLYYIDWDDIIHMGENPTLLASGYYNAYYKNSNAVFVYAHWEEVDYKEIDLKINGNGSCNMGEKIYVEAGETVWYNLKPDTGHCISEVKINGVPVSIEKLKEISNDGLTFENINEDISIDVTFSEGIYLVLNKGENIKDAYMTTTINGEEKRFRDGECILIPDGKLVYAVTIKLVVEVFDDENGYTYILENIGNYTPLEKGVFTKNVFVSKSAKFLEINVDSAVKTLIEEVKLSYTAGTNILDHYLSTDKNAKSGEKGSGTYDEGQVVYLFVKKREDTNIYCYVLPSSYEDIGGGWYRRAIYVNAQSPRIGSVSATREYQEYTVHWVNWDGTKIYNEYYYYGDVPVYYNENENGDIVYPTRPDDERYSYTFVGWTPFIDSVKEEVTYTAVFAPTLKQYTVTIEPSENGVVKAPTEGNTITNQDSVIYTFIPNVGYQIKDVLINGVSVGAVSSYTFTGVTQNQTIRVEYEPQKLDITIKMNGNGSVSCDNSLNDVIYGESRALTFSAEKGWQVSRVFVNGEQTKLENGQLLIEKMTEDLEIIVLCEEINVGFIISISAVSLVALVSASLAVVLVAKRPKKRFKIPGVTPKK